MTEEAFERYLGQTHDKVVIGTVLITESLWYYVFLAIQLVVSESFYQCGW